MTVRNLLATVAAFGLAGAALAQDPTPSTPDQTTPPQPATTTPAPGVVQGGYVQPMTYTYPQGTIVQSGYTQLMTYYPQGTVLPSGYAQPMTYYPQGQVIPAGAVLPGQVVSRPGMMTTYGTPPMTAGVVSYPSVTYPTTSYPTVGGVSGVSSYPSYGYTTVGTTGYAYPSFANGYANMSAANSGGFVSNVVGTPTRAVRRLFRR